MTYLCCLGILSIRRNTDSKDNSFYIIDVKIKPLILASVTAVVSLVVMAKSNNNIVEEVAWMVGDQPIYKSDIEEQYQQMLYERVPIDGDPYCVIPEQMAVQKLFLHQADIDTITVSESMVQAQVDSYVNNLISNIGSKEKLENTSASHFLK